jgi:hypothetical protein
MKKVTLLAVLVCTLGAFAGRPSADVSHQVVRDTISPQVMMQDSGWLPTEAYDAV